MCAELNVSRSGYYDWCRRQAQPGKRASEDARLRFVQRSALLRFPDVIDAVGAEVTNVKVGDRVLTVSAQGAYAEYYFAPVLWPDFSRADLITAITEYSKRERRYGQTGAQVKPVSA